MRTVNVDKWIPAELAVLFGGFLAAEATHYGMASWLVAQVPVVIVLLVLAVAWKWPKAGSLAFLLVALLGYWATDGVIFLLESDPWTTVACLCLPPVICAVLFWFAKPAGHTHEPASIHRWSPRILVPLFALFLASGAFAMGWPYMLLALLVTCVVLRCLAFGWKRPRIGSVVWFVIAVALVPVTGAMAFLSSTEPGISLSLLAVLALICAVLFWFVKRP
jgi:hypothetical protein